MAQMYTVLLGIETILGILAVWLLDSGNALLCVRCDSSQETRKGECENDPPPAVPCHGSNNDQQYCLIARELDKDGNQIKFVRDCSTAEYNTCTIYGNSSSSQPYKVCYSTCQGDGCNAATWLQSSWSLCLLAVFFII